MGTTHEIGKNVGDDLAEGKPTLPLIHAMRDGRRRSSAQVISAGHPRTAGSTDIQAVLAAVESTGAITYTSRAAADRGGAPP